VLVQVRNLLQDIEKAEKRLEDGKLKEKVLFHCTTKRYLRALKGEWDKAGKAKADAKKAASQSKKKAGVLLEPPLQPKAQKQRRLLCVVTQDAPERNVELLPTISSGNEHILTPS
jgi:predicted  nucleic acid-binding Zn-ribbon protein